MSNSLLHYGMQHARLPWPSPTAGVCSNSCPSCQWCHPTSSSSVVPFSSCLQSFPASGSFQMSQFFTSGGQSTGASASVSVLPMDIQDWIPLGWTGLISFQFKGLSRVVIQPLLYPYKCSLLGHSYLTTSCSRETLNLHIKSLLWEIVKTRMVKWGNTVLSPLINKKFYLLIYYPEMFCHLCL